MSVDILSTLLPHLSGAPLAAAVLIVVAAIAIAIVLRALAVLLREIPAVIEARRRTLVAPDHQVEHTPRQRHDVSARTGRPADVRQARAGGHPPST